MRTFRYELGHVGLETMTVAELKAKLSEYPDDMPVIASWEGQAKAIVGDHFELSKGWDYGHPDDAADVLFIDVEW